MIDPSLLEKADLSKLSDHDLQNLVWEAERTKAMTDLYWLVTEVLGYKDLGAIHKPLCLATESINPVVLFMSGSKRYRTISMAKRGVKQGVEHTQAVVGNTPLQQFFQVDSSFTRLFLMFRGSFKTTIITIAHTIQLMLLWPDIRILLASHKKEDGSEPILTAIKHHFIRNNKFRALFPEYCPKANKQGVIEWGTREKIILPNRSETANFPEATIEIAGMTTDVTGRHYDYIKKDDLVTKESVTNDTMIRKTRYFDSLMKFLFNQPEWGVSDYIGTPYHFNDLYASMRKTKGVSKVIVPVTSKTGIITFPERFTKEGLDEIKHSPEMGSYTYSCQYELNPVPTEDQTFRPEWLERLGFRYDQLPENLRRYMFVDPASKRARQSDYTAIMVLGVDPEGTWFLIDCIRDKLSVEDRTNLVFHMAQTHGIRLVHYESIGFQDTDRFIVERKSREGGWPISARPLKFTRTSKEDRIRGLQPVYERGLIRWPQSCVHTTQYEKRSEDMLEILRDEMLMFPKIEHDDLLDCHAFALQVNMPKAHQAREEPRDDLFMRLRQQVIDRKKGRPFHGFGKKGQERVWGRIPARRTLF